MTSGCPVRGSRPSPGAGGDAASTRTTCSPERQRRGRGSKLEVRKSSKSRIARGTPDRGQPRIATRGPRPGPCHGHAETVSWRRAPAASGSLSVISPAPSGRRGVRTGAQHPGPRRDDRRPQSGQRLDCLRRRRADVGDQLDLAGMKFPFSPAPPSPEAGEHGIGRVDLRARVRIDEKQLLLDAERERIAGPEGMGFVARHRSGVPGGGEAQRLRLKAALGTSDSLDWWPPVEQRMLVAGSVRLRRIARACSR